jgi:hypothetical protein
MKKSTTHNFPRRQRTGIAHVLFFLIISMSFIFSNGCASVNVGYDFPADQVKNIQIGITAKEDILTIFGEPWRVGLENGQETWTYGKYNYSGFKETDAKDLVVRFTENDIVESYTFSTTNR